MNINVYITGCHLTLDVENGSPSIYLVLLNTDTKWHSEIRQWNGTFEFDIEKDGIYKIYAIDEPNAVLNNGILSIENERYDSERFVDTIESNITHLGSGENYTEEIFCICNLRKCLLNLQMKAFQNMLKNCGSRKCKDDEIKAQRDFIFIAVWLMDRLMEQGKEEQVREIYESIQGCGSICSDILKSNRCGCNE